MSNIWVISDTHFGHSNIIRYCNRPWQHGCGEVDVHAMNKALTSNWNACVQPDDTVVHVGDFAYGRTASPVSSYLEKLNGYKILVKGNHDHCIERMLEYGFDEVYTQYKLEQQKVIFNHYPPQKMLKHTYQQYAGWTWVHGHIHNNAESIAEVEALRASGAFGPLRLFNASVEVNDYKPVLLEEILNG